MKISNILPKNHNRDVQKSLLDVTTLQGVQAI